MKPVRWITIAATISLAGLAQAGEAIIESLDGSGQRARMQLEYSGDNRVRINVPGRPGGYLLVRDGNAYSVSQQGGRTYVMNLSSLSESGFAVPTAGPAEIGGVNGLENTGREETVAGIRGEVWMLSYTDGRGATRTDEIVLSSDARARELARAMRHMASATSGSADPLAPHIGDKGVLRMGDRLRVTALAGTQPAASRFTLPAQPTAMPDLGGLGEKIGELLGQKAERQVDRQKQHVDQRTDWETDRAMDDKVDGLLDRLFGD